MIPKDFSVKKTFQITPLDKLSPAVAALVPKEGLESPWQEPHPVDIVTTGKNNVRCTESAGHYFAGGLPALMQAARMLGQDPSARVTYVTDGQLKKSTQSAHQGHVHPTEWTAPDLRTFHLIGLLLRSLKVLPTIAPEDVQRYSYHHFPLSSIEIPLFLRFFIYRIAHTLLSKNGVSDDDRWQCDAVRASLAFHKSLSDEILASGGNQTFAYGERIVWSPDLKALEEKHVLWTELGIRTEWMQQTEFEPLTLLKVDAPLYAFKVLEDGKFFPHTDAEIIRHLQKKYPDRFQTQCASVSTLYVDRATQTPFAVQECSTSGPAKTLAIDSFFGSTGHNRVFHATEKKKPLWHEVPVSGVSTLWVCSVSKNQLLHRLHTKDLSDSALVERIKNYPGMANLTNLHTTIWNAVVEGDTVHIIVRATQGANFNSELADPQDLQNMTANLNRFFTGTWMLISCGTCVRKTAISNVPELKEHFLHGLSGIGLSISAAPKELFIRKPLTDNFLKKICSRIWSKT